jgi:tRNA (cytosine38-C5)-methyltransferase
MLVDKLRHCGYDFQEFLLTPLQLGIPNSRMRYYLLAKLKAYAFAKPVTGTIIGYIPLSTHMSQEFVDTRGGKAKIEDEEGLIDESVTPVDPLSKFLDHTDHYGDYLVPDKVLAKNSHVFDIVKPDGHRSCCFTKGYYHYAQGTGSVLQMNQDVDVSFRVSFSVSV